MHKDVLLHVQSCTVCAQAKPDHTGYPRLLQPLQVPRQSWEVVSLDFVEGLPLSSTFSVILVVVVKFSKFAHFIPLKHPYSTTSVARVFLDNIYKLHGLPVAIIFDRDRVFTSKFWQLLFQLAGTDLRMSTTYHPQRTS